MFFKGKRDQECQETGEAACGTRECSCPILDGKMTEFGGIRSLTPEQMPDQKHPALLLISPWQAVRVSQGRAAWGAVCSESILPCQEPGAPGSPFGGTTCAVQCQRGPCSLPTKGSKCLSDIKTASVSKLEGKE